MESLKQSPVALNVYCAPYVRALLKGANGSNYHISLKYGLFGTRLFKTHNAFPFKVSQVAHKNRTRIVMQDSAAGSYATSLVELAQLVKSLDAISRDIDKLSQYITNKVFFNFLVNPIIPDEKKKGILEDITNDAKFQPYILNFFYILIDKKRIDLIGEIFKEFETVYNKLTNTKLAVVSYEYVMELHSEALIHADDTLVWSTNTFNKGVAGIELRTNGNLVLYNKNNRSVWQSFDHPIDILLVGQSLKIDTVKKLVNRASEKDESEGPYSLVMEAGGFAMYASFLTPLPYNTLSYYDKKIKGMLSIMRV
ncbi:hypothetical protein KI387_001675, partial [Taxus chinensis]